MPTATRSRQQGRAIEYGFAVALAVAAAGFVASEVHGVAVGADARPSTAALLTGLAPLERGGTLFEESGDAFAIVAGEAQAAHFVALEVELLVQSAGTGGADDVLDRGEAERGERGELRGQRVDFGVERIVVDAFPDQAPVGGGGGGERLAGQREAERAGLADQAREGASCRRCRGSGPSAAKLWMNLAELAGDDQVAGERDVGAGAGGDSVDAGDDRLGHGGEATDQRVPARLDRFAEVDRFVGGDHAVVEILPGAEAAPGAGEDDDASVAGGIERVGQFGVHRARKSC